MTDPELTHQIGLLTIDVNVLRLAVAEMVADHCLDSGDPDAALRDFSENLHKRVDAGPSPPAAIQGMIEAARQRIDELIRSVQVSLDRRG